MSLKPSCISRFQRAFTAYVYVFKEMTLVSSIQRYFFDNATACSKRTLKTRVATSLNTHNTFFFRSETPSPVLPDEVQHELPLMYNWTEVERYDSTDLRLWLRGLRPYAQYEILVQAFNQFGRGPMARAKAFTLSDGEKR